MPAAGNHIAEPAVILVDGYTGLLPPAPAWDTCKSVVADVEMHSQVEVSSFTQEVTVGICVAGGAPMDVDIVVALQIADGVCTEEDSNMLQEEDDAVEMKLDGIAHELAPHTLITPHLMFPHLGYTGLLFPENIHPQPSPPLLADPMNNLQPLPPQPPSISAVNSFHAAVPIGSG